MNAHGQLMTKRYLTKVMEISLAKTMSQFILSSVLAEDQHTKNWMNLNLSGALIVRTIHMAGHVLSMMIILVNYNLLITE